LNVSIDKKESPTPMKLILINLLLIGTMADTSHVTETLFASAPWIPALQDDKRLRYKTYFSVQFPLLGF